MIQRCSNPNYIGYANYGERGITVCEEWQSFDRFLADMGPKPAPRHTIERLDNELGYSKANCVWATQQVNLNNRRTTVFASLNGERMPFADACRKAGVPYGTAFLRKKKGWPESRWFDPVSAEP
jgi:hypothetical protein